MRATRNILKRAPSLLLLLIFISGWLAVPVRLAMPEPVMCGMKCCEEAGVCYCTHKHDGDASDAGTKIDRITPPCSQNCVAVLSLSLRLPAADAPAEPLKPGLDGPTSLPEPAAASIQTLLLGCDRAPRAPPLLLENHSI